MPNSFRFLAGASLGALLANAASAQTVAASAPSTASAQSTANPANTPPVAAPSSNTNEIGDIVVTARKRNESVQKVPIAISAFSADTLAARGFTSAQDLQQTVPGLVYSAAAAGVGLITLRGVGGSSTRATAPGRNPAVPIHVNGVYLQSPSVMLQDFLDVDRIEVLRGPQGTLYGRNAVGGSINIITRRPTKEVSGEIGIDVGNYDKRRIYGVLSGPISDRLRARVAFSMEDRDGYVKNLAIPTTSLESSNYSNVRATLEYDLASNALVSVTGYYYRNTGVPYSFRPTVLPRTGIGVYDAVPTSYVPASIGNLREVRQDTPGSGLDETKGVTGDIRWDLDGVTLRSITGYFDMRTDSTYDGDGIELPQAKIVTFLTQRYKTFNEELQLSSDNNGPVKWLLGGYFYHERSEGGILVDYTTSTAPVYVDYNNPPGSIRARSLAAFGQVDWSITDKFTLTGGLRFTSDRMSAVRSGLITYFGFPIVDFSNIRDSKSWSKLTWKAGANYQVTDDIMLYATYSRGYKAGGFNLQDNAAPFNPEQLDAYEAGVKSSLFDRHLQINASTYLYKYKNKQEVVADVNGISQYLNSGKATIKGVELEVVARPVTDLQLTGSLSYMHARYDEFSTVDTENAALGVQNLAGRHLTDAPDWQGSIGGQYGHDLGGSLGRLSISVDQSFTGARFARAFNLATDRLDSYSITNARLWWDSADRQWTAELYVKNLGDKNIVSSFAETGPFNDYIHQNAYLAPRTYGGRLTYRF